MHLPRVPCLRRALPHLPPQGAGTAPWETAPPTARSPHPAGHRPQLRRSLTPARPSTKRRAVQDQHLRSCCFLKTRDTVQQSGHPDTSRSSATPGTGLPGGRHGPPAHPETPGPRGDEKLRGGRAALWTELPEVTCTQDTPLFREKCHADLDVSHILSVVPWLQESHLGLLLRETGTSWGKCPCLPSLLWTFLFAPPLPSPAFFFFFFLHLRLLRHL